MNFVPPPRRVSPRRALIVSAISLSLPWAIRRWLLRVLCGYSFGRTRASASRCIGCTSLQMGASARIGHFNVVKGMRVDLGERATIGDFNWISGLGIGNAKTLHR